MPEFVPALELNAEFYAEVIAPLVGALPHAAALLGSGSEILGFDTERSTDHGWGPRLQVFVTADQIDAVRARIDGGLPDQFRDWPVQYISPDGTPPRHHVAVLTLEHWLEHQIGRDPRRAMTALDWLLTPQQRLLGVVRGAVYRDDDGELERVRQQLQWYPDNVARWMLACQWQRVAQEEAFVGRTAEVGDEMGSRLVAARLVRELARIWFLLERRYWPYTKWFGTAFAQLPETRPIIKTFERVLAATDFKAREAALVDAYEMTARRHNESEITPPVVPRVRSYYGRGFLVLMSERFVHACLAEVTDPAISALPLVGSIDQFVDSTDVLQVPARANALRALLEEAGDRVDNGRRLL